MFVVRFYEERSRALLLPGLRSPHFPWPDFLQTDPIKSLEESRRGLAPRKQMTVILPFLCNVSLLLQRD